MGYDSILEFCSSTRHPFIEPRGLKSGPVRRLTKWMYDHNEMGETILGDSRNIQRLAVIVADGSALSILVDSDSLKRAFAVTKGVEVEFHELLTEIEWQIGEAVSTVAIVDINEGHRSIISNIFRQARYLRQGSEDI